MRGKIAAPVIPGSRPVRPGELHLEERRVGIPLQSFSPDARPARALLRRLRVHVDVEPAQEIVVLAEVGAVLAPGLAELRPLDLAPLADHRVDDLARHLVEERPGVRSRPVEALRPDVLAALRILELRRDPELVALPPHAPLEHVVDPERLAHLPHVARRPAEGEGRPPRHHEHVRRAGEHRDDVLGDTGAEILPRPRVAAHEGKNRHRRRPPRCALGPEHPPATHREDHQRADQTRADGTAPPAVPCRAAVGQWQRQPVAPARNGLDQPLVVVAERPADLPDALHEAVVGHRDVGPDGLHEVVLGDEPAPVLDEVPQHREGLRPKRAGLSRRVGDPLRVEIDREPADDGLPVSPTPRCLRHGPSPECPTRPRVPHEPGPRPQDSPAAGLAFGKISAGVRRRFGTGRSGRPQTPRYQRRTQLCWNW